jgi:hypothetical protein
MVRNDFQDINAGRMSFDGMVHLPVLINGMTAEMLGLFRRVFGRLEGALPGRKPRKKQTRRQVLPPAVLRDRLA